MLSEEDTLSNLGTVSTLTASSEAKKPPFKSSKSADQMSMPNSYTNCSLSANEQKIMGEPASETAARAKNTDSTENYEMTISCVDSGIAGTISIDSELSASCYRGEESLAGPSGIHYSTSNEKCDIKFEVNIIIFLI